MAALGFTMYTLLRLVCPMFVQTLYEYILMEVISASREIDLAKTYVEHIHNFAKIWDKYTCKFTIFCHDIGTKDF